MKREFQLNDRFIDAIEMKLSKRARKQAHNRLPDDMSQSDKDLIIDQCISAGDVAIREGLRVVKTLEGRIEHDMLDLILLDTFSHITRGWASAAIDRIEEKVSGDGESFNGCGDPDCPACSDPGFNPSKSIRGLIEKLARGSANIVKTEKGFVYDGEELDGDKEKMARKNKALLEMIRATADARRAGQGAMMIGHVDRRTGKEELFELDDADIRGLEEVLSGEADFDALDTFFEGVKTRQQRKSATLN
jgi:hypothetical protein